MPWFRRQAPITWGEAEAALVAECARDHAVRSSGQRGVRVLQVYLDGDEARARLLLLDGEQSVAYLRRHLGQWTFVAFAERQD